MSRRNAAPTFFWVLMSQVNKWLALIFIAIIFVFVMVSLGVANQVRSTCRPYEKSFDVVGHHVSIVVRDGDGMCVSN